MLRTHVVDFRERCLRSIDSAAVGKNDVKTNDLVHSKTPVTGSIAVTTMGEVSTNTNAGAGSVGESALALVVDTLSQVAQSEATADLGDSLVIEGHVLEFLKIDDHGAILATGREGSIGVTSTPCLDLDVILGCADHSIRDMLDGGGDNNDSRLVVQVNVVGLGQLREVGIQGELDGNVLLGQAVGQSGRGSTGGLRGGGRASSSGRFGCRGTASSTTGTGARLAFGATVGSTVSAPAVLRATRAKCRTLACVTGRAATTAVG